MYENTIHSNPIELNSYKTVSEQHQSSEGVFPFDISGENAFPRNVTSKIFDGNLNAFDVAIALPTTGVIIAIPIEEILKMIMDELVSIYGGVEKVPQPIKKSVEEEAKKGTLTEEKGRQIIEFAKQDVVTKNREEKIEEEKKATEARRRRESVVAVTNKRIAEILAPRLNKNSSVVDAVTRFIKQLLNNNKILLDNKDFVADNKRKTARKEYLDKQEKEFADKINELVEELNIVDRAVLPELIQRSLNSLFDKKEGKPAEFQEGALRLFLEAVKAIK